MKALFRLPTGFRDFKSVHVFLSDALDKLNNAINSIDYDQRSDTRNDKGLTVTDVNGEVTITFNKAMTKEPHVVPYVRDAATAYHSQVKSATVVGGKYTGAVLKVYDMAGVAVGAGVLVGAIIRERK